MSVTANCQGRSKECDLDLSLWESLCGPVNTVVVEFECIDRKFVLMHVFSDSSELVGYLNNMLPSV